MRKNWSLWIFCVVTFYPEDLRAVMMGNAPQYSPGTNRAQIFPGLLQGMFGGGQLQNPQMQPQNPQQYQPYPQQYVPQGQQFQQLPQQVIPQQNPPFGGVMGGVVGGLFPQVIQQTVQQSPQRTPQEEEQTLWNKIYAQIYAKEAPDAVMKTFDEVENWAQGKNVYTPASFLAFVTNARQVTVAQSMAVQQVLPNVPPQQAIQMPQQATPGEAISLLEACVFTGNSALFSALIDRFLGQNVMPESLLGTLLTRLGSSAGVVPRPVGQTAVSNVKKQEFPKGVRADLKNKTAVQTTWVGGLPLLMQDYASLLSYILENQKTTEFAAVLKVFDAVSEKNNIATLGALLHQTLAFFCQNKISLQDAFWKTVSDKVWDTVFAYETQQKIDGSLPESLLFMAAKAGRFDILKLLINNGINAEATMNVNGQSCSFVELLPKPKESVQVASTVATGGGRGQRSSRLSTKAEEKEDTEVKDFAVWFFKGMDRAHGLDPAYLCLDFLKILPKKQRIQFMDSLKGQAFLNYFMQTLAAVDETVISEFLGYVPFQTVIPMLQLMTPQELGTFCSKIQDAELQKLMRALMELPESPAKAQSSKLAQGASKTKPKTPKIEALGVFWKIPNPTLQARFLTLLLGVEELGAKELCSIFPEVMPDAVLPFLDFNLDEKASGYKKFMKVLPSIFPLLTSVPPQALGIFCSKMKDGDLQQLMRALMELPESPEKQKSSSTLIKTSSKTRAKAPKIDALDAFWTVPDVALQAHLMTLIMEFDALDVKGLSTFLSRMSPDATIPFLEENLAEKAPGRKKFLEFLPKMTDLALVIRFITPLLTAQIVTAKEREDILLKMPQDAWNGLIQNIFSNTPEKEFVPEVVATLLQKSTTPAFAIHLFKGVLPQFDRPDELLVCIPDDMFLNFVKQWIQPVDAQKSKSARDKKSTVQAATQARPQSGKRSGGSAQAMRSNAVKTTSAIAVNADHLDTLLRVQNLPLLARMMTVLLELNALDVKTLNHALQEQNMPNEALSPFLESVLSRPHQDPTRGRLLSFFKTGNIAVVAPILDVVDRLSGDLQTPLVSLPEFTAILEARDDKGFSALIEAFFGFEEGQFPPFLDKFFTAQQSSNFLAKLLSTIVDLKGASVNCTAFLERLNPAVVPSVLKEMKEDKVRTLLRSLVLANAREIPQPILTLFKQVQDPDQLVFLLATAAAVDGLKNVDLGDVLWLSHEPISNDLLKRVLETLLGVTPGSEGVSKRRGTAGKGKESKVDRSTLLQRMQSPDFVVHALALMDAPLLTNIPQNVLEAYMKIIMSLEKGDNEALGVAFQVLQNLITDGRFSEKLKGVLKVVQQKSHKSGQPGGMQIQTLAFSNASWQTLLETAITNENAEAVSALLGSARPSEQTSLDPWQRYYGAILNASNQGLIKKDIFKKEQEAIERSAKEIIKGQVDGFGLSEEEASERSAAQWKDFVDGAQRMW